MKQVRGMYFSGTGTTERIVRTIVEELTAEGFAGAEEINFTPPQARRQSYEFGPEDVVIFGVPVIAGRVPNVLLKFLLGDPKNERPSCINGGGALAVPVVLYGNRNYDDALIELRNILEERGFHTVAAGAFIGEHSFSKILAAGRPDAEDIVKAKAFAGQIADKIKSMGEADAPIEPDPCAENPGTEDSCAEHRAIAPIEVKGETPIRDYYKPRDRHGEHINILKVIPKLDEAKCTGCGICVDACPMGSIKKEAPGVVDGICIKCCGCEKKCPEGALYFDDPGYIYHKEELEFLYAKERREPEVFI